MIDFALLRQTREQSNDPVTQTAAVIQCSLGQVAKSNWVDHETPGTLTRSERLDLSTHAEIRTMAAADRLPGIDDLSNLVMQSIGTPCASCAQAIVDFGIGTLFIDHESDPFKDRLDDPRYDFDKAFRILEKGGTDVRRVGGWDRLR